MELLTLPQLAESAAIPLSAARYYRDRFILFVPSVRVGRTVLHPVEAVEVLTHINQLAAGGASVNDIESALEHAYPVSVVTSQGISGDVATNGPAGVIVELAHVIDGRGERVEHEIVSLREQLAGTATATQLEGVVFETRLAAHAINERFGSEMQAMKSNVEELRSQVSHLASRDQLEWIGDVVSAAITRSPGAGPSGPWEKRLLEIQEELQRPRPSDDVAELRVAVDRLAEHVSNRDKEFQRTLHALVNVMRTEIRTLQSDLKSGSMVQPVEEPIPAASPTEKKVEEAPPPPAPVSVESVVTLEAPEQVNGGENGKHRAPRRLGHLSRHADPFAVDAKPLNGAEDSL